MHVLAADHVDIVPSSPLDDDLVGVRNVARQHVADSFYVHPGRLREVTDEGQKVCSEFREMLRHLLAALITHALNDKIIQPINAIADDVHLFLQIAKFYRDSGET